MKPEVLLFDGVVFSALFLAWRKRFWVRISGIILFIGCALYVLLFALPK